MRTGFKIISLNSELIPRKIYSLFTVLRLINFRTDSVLVRLGKMPLSLIWYPDHSVSDGINFDFPSDTR